MNNLEIKHNKLTADEFVYLWESVWSDAPTKEQIELALTNSIYVVSVYDRGKVAAMARMIGDIGLCYYIKDVIVHPDYQKQGIGSGLINELLDFIKSNGISGTQIFMELCAMPDKIPFYEKFGFSANETQRLRIMLPVE